MSSRTDVFDDILCRIIDVAQLDRAALPEPRQFSFAFGPDELENRLCLRFRCALESAALTLARWAPMVRAQMAEFDEKSPIAQIASAPLRLSCEPPPLAGSLRRPLEIHAQSALIYIYAYVRRVWEEALRGVDASDDVQDIVAGL